LISVCKTMDRSWLGMQPEQGGRSWTKHSEIAGHEPRHATNNRFPSFFAHDQSSAPPRGTASHDWTPEAVPRASRLDGHRVALPRFIALRHSQGELLGATLFLLGSVPSRQCSKNPDH